jgi:hypothetical protein
MGKGGSEFAAPELECQEVAGEYQRTITNAPTSRGEGTGDPGRAAPTSQRARRMNPWRAGCSETGTSGSASGQEKPTHRNVDRALLADSTTATGLTSHSNNDPRHRPTSRQTPHHRPSPCFEPADATDSSTNTETPHDQARPTFRSAQAALCRPVKRVSSSHSSQVLGGPAHGLQSIRWPLTPEHQATSRPTRIPDAYMYAATTGPPARSHTL